MYTQVKDSYANAYVEILEIIKNMDKKSREKIPMSLISFFEENKDDSYEFELDVNKNEIFSSKTIDLLTLIEVKYLTTGKDRELLEKALIENDKRNEQEAREKYNLNNLFESNKKITRKEVEQPEVYENVENSVVVKKDSIFIKIVDWFKNIFKIKK